MMLTYMVNLGRSLRSLVQALVESGLLIAAHMNLVHVASVILKVLLMSIFSWLEPY